MIDLDALIVEAREQERVKEEALRAEREAAAAEIRAQAIAQFIELLTGELGAELLDALHPIYEARLHQKLASVTAQWHDDDSATDWSLTRLSDSFDAIFALKAWSVRGSSMATHLDWSAIRQRELRHKLLSGIGFVREVVEAQRKKDEIVRLQREEQQQQAERDRQLREQEEAELLAAADEVHAEIEALIAQRTAEEQAKLWQWKPGATITLYTVRYCTGTRYVEEEGSEFDYATGWTLTDELDANGYLKLIMPKERYLRLDPHTHMPIWERHTFSTFDELPRDLRERSGFVIEGITKRNFSDGKWRWVYDRSESWGCTAAPDGLPVEWVRFLVDGA